MVYALGSVLLLALSVAQTDVDAGAGVQPSATPISWEFEFTYLDPRRIEVLVPGQAQPEVFWYMVYTVSNTSRAAQRFFPMFQIVTEDLRVYDTDIDINPLVFEAIRERHRITHPELVSPTKAIGALLSGRDNGRESVAIWRQIDLSQASFRVYVAGLSGETRFVPNPVHDATRPQAEVVIDEDGREREIVVNPEYFTLRKTLEIRYTLPGSPQSRQNVLPQRETSRWIMR